MESNTRNSQVFIRDILLNAMIRFIPILLIVVVILIVYNSISPTIETTSSSILPQEKHAESPHELNQPAIKRFVSTSSEAKCIDGSTPVYYIRKGRDEGANKLVVHFEGGGWCYDLEACYLRSKTGLGSSSGYPDIMGNY